jgi:hypothetical protein
MLSVTDIFVKINYTSHIRYDKMGKMFQLIKLSSGPCQEH